MKNLLFITFIFVVEFALAQCPLVEYEKLNPEKMEEAFKLGSLEHTLGHPYRIFPG